MQRGSEAAAANSIHSLVADVCFCSFDCLFVFCGRKSCREANGGGRYMYNTYVYAVCGGNALFASGRVSFLLFHSERNWTCVLHSGRHKIVRGFSNAPLNDTQANQPTDLPNASDRTIIISCDSTNKAKAAPSQSNYITVNCFLWWTGRLLIV